jgi:hypothetical protein
MVFTTVTSSSSELSSWPQSKLHYTITYVRIRTKSPQSGSRGDASARRPSVALVQEGIDEVDDVAAGARIAGRGSGLAGLQRAEELLQDLAHVGR